MMRLLFVPVCWALALASLIGCGAGGPQCAIDTDCPLGERCASDGTCQLLGVGVDSGAPPSDGGARDASIGDAGRRDASAGDAGSGEDAGGGDASHGDGGASMMMMEPPPTD